MNQTFTQALSNEEREDLLAGIASAANFFMTIHTKAGRINFKIKLKAMDGLYIRPASPINEDLSGKAKVDFVYNSVLYQTEADLQLQEDGVYHLAFKNEIFKVQRRANFRTELPVNWEKHVLIDQVEQSLISVEGEIVDISLGGCFFTTKDKTQIELGNQVYGTLTVSEYPPLKFRGIIRRNTTRPEGKAYAVEFIELEDHGNQTLNNMTLKAARLTRDYNKKT